MVPSDLEDPQRCKGRVASLLLKHARLFCSPVEHDLRIDIHLILRMVFLEGEKIAQECCSVAQNNELFHAAQKVNLADIY